MIRKGDGDGVIDIDGAVLCGAVQFSTMQYSTGQCSAMQYSIVQCSSFMQGIKVQGSVIGAVKIIFVSVLLSAYIKRFSVSHMQEFKI